MRQLISGLVAAVAVMTVGAVPAMACGGGLFQSSCSPCGQAYVSPCAQAYVEPVYSGCNTGCGGWGYPERLPDPVQQYYYVNQGPTYTGPGNFAPARTYQEGGYDRPYHYMAVIITILFVAPHRLRLWRPLRLPSRLCAALLRAAPLRATATSTVIASTCCAVTTRSCSTVRSESGARPHLASGRLAFHDGPIRPSLLAPMQSASTAAFETLRALDLAGHCPCARPGLQVSRVNCRRCLCLRALSTTASGCRSTTAPASLAALAIEPHRQEALVVQLVERAREICNRDHRDQFQRAGSGFSPARRWPPASDARW